MQDCKNFLKVIKELNPYFIKFNKDKTIKNKKYLLDCIIKGTNQRLVNIIIYNKSIFFINDSI